MNDMQVPKAESEATLKNLKVRLAEPLDVPDLMVMMQDGLAEMGFGFKDDATLLQFILAGAFFGDPIILVAYREKRKKQRLVAMMVGELQVQPFRKDLIIAYGQFTYVKSEYRHSGLGKLLLAEAEKVAISKGAKEIFFETDKPKAFEKDGYEQVFVGIRKKLVVE